MKQKPEAEDRGNALPKAKRLSADVDIEKIPISQFPLSRCGETLTEVSSVWAYRLATIFCRAISLGSLPVPMIK